MKRHALLPVVLLLTSGCGYAGMDDLPLPGGPELGSDPYSVSVDFDNVLDLAEQSTVRVDGVSVGQVDKITRRGWKARVTLMLRSDVVLPANTEAHITQSSLLGEKFVDLSGSKTETGANLADGDHIKLADTSRGSEVEEVLGALSLLLNGGGVAQLKTISKEMHAALDSGSVDTTTFLRELDSFISTLDRNRDEIVSTLENVNRLTATINKDHDVVDRALDDIGPGLEVLSGQQKQLVSMFKHLSTFSDVSSDVIETSGADLTADLKALEPVLAELEKSGDKVPQALEDILSFPFPDAVLEAVKGDYVNLAVEVDLSPLALLNNISGGQATLEGLGALPSPVPTAKAPADGSPAVSAPQSGAAAPSGLLDLLLVQLTGGTS